MENFTKIVRIGSKREYEGSSRFMNVYANIEFADGRLSITGVEGPTSNGNARGSCGQIQNGLEPDSSSWQFAPGWSVALLKEFQGVWKRWHLNDMNAGTFEQMEALRNWKDKPEHYDYDAMCEYLKRIGLYEVEHDGKPYKFGHAWIKEAMPQSAYDMLHALPDTDKKPAWV